MKKNLAKMCDNVPNGSFRLHFLKVFNKKKITLIILLYYYLLWKYLAAKIEVDFENIKRLSNCIAKEQAIKRETIEIIDLKLNKNTVKEIEYFKLDERYCCMLTRTRNIDVRGHGYVNKWQTKHSPEWQWERLGLISTYIER